MRRGRPSGNSGPALRPGSPRRKRLRAPGLSDRRSRLVLARQPCRRASCWRLRRRCVVLLPRLLLSSAAWPPSPTLRLGGASPALCAHTWPPWRSGLVAWGPPCAEQDALPTRPTRLASDVQARPGRRPRAGGALRLRRRRAAEQPHLLRRRLGRGAGADAEGGRNSSLTLFAQAVRGWLTFAAAAALQVFTKYLKTKAWDVRVLVRAAEPGPVHVSALTLRGPV